MSARENRLIVFQDTDVFVDEFLENRSDEEDHISLCAQVRVHVWVETRVGE